jgi:hypothetical protein
MRVACYVTGAGRHGVEQPNFTTASWKIGHISILAVKPSTGHYNQKKPAYFN